jgi:hypothetical protein
MPQFSDRIGVTQPRQTIQVETIDASLRNALWNWTLWALDAQITRYQHNQWRYWKRLATKGELWDAFFHLPVDELPNDSAIAVGVKSWFMKAKWYEVYNFIEYVLPLIDWVRESDPHRDAEERLNLVLERELSGYRAIKGDIVAVTSPVEIEEIHRAATPKQGFEAIAVHISQALALLGKKPDPDYRNSVKESISAVESAAKLLTGKKSHGIDTALAVLDGKHHLHPAFKTALSKLYSYTSDDDGIRHSILDEATVTEPEARFMLVACSAFANWLISVGTAKTTA